MPESGRSARRCRSCSIESRHLRRSPRRLFLALRRVRPKTELAPNPKTFLRAIAPFLGRKEYRIPACRNTRDTLRPPLLEIAGFIAQCGFAPDLAIRAARKPSGSQNHTNANQRARTTTVALSSMQRSPRDVPNTPRAVVRLACTSNGWIRMKRQARPARSRPGYAPACSRPARNERTCVRVFMHLT